MIYILIILFLQVICDAVGDAMRFRCRQVLHHFFEALQIVCWGAAIYLSANNDISSWGNILVYYVCVRFIFFDTIFNLIAKLKWDYVGRFSLYGMVFARFGKIASPESAANTFKYLLALPLLIGTIYNLMAG
jgi:hypothetical protein